jgi:hypothetical protein
MKRLVCSWGVKCMVLHFVEISQRRVDSPQDTAHVSLPRRGRNMAAQGK